MRVLTKKLAITVLVRPGSKAEVRVDGQPVGRLNSETLAAVAFSGDEINSTYVDDVELYYAE